MYFSVKGIQVHSIYAGSPIDYDDGNDSKIMLIPGMAIKLAIK